MGSSAHDTEAALDPEMLMILEEFLVECRETIAEVEPLILTLEPGSESSSQQAAIAVIFRLFHSMKGSAGFIGLRHIEHVTHASESVLDVLRQKPRMVSPGVIDLLCTTLDFTSRSLDTVEREQTDGGIADEAAVQLARVKDCLAQLQDNTLPPETEDDSDDDVLPAIEVPPEFVGKFVAEAMDQIDTIETQLLAVDAAGPACDDDVLATAFREVHSFKGNCGFLGLVRLEKVAHAMEDLLEQLKSTPAARTSASVSLLLRGLDGLRKATSDLEKTRGAVPNYRPLLAALRATLAGDTDPATAFSQRDLVTLAVALLRSGRVAVAEVPALIAVERNEDDGNLATEHHPASAPTSSSPTPTASQAARPATALSPAPNSPPSTPAAAANDDDPPSANAAAKHIRVEVEKLDVLLNQVGELINASASISHDPDAQAMGSERFDQAASHLDRITRSLHDTAMAMRMVPLGSTFRKMLRVVRDVARKTGKNVDLDIRGETTEVDKTVIESISDPLVHIVRNAVDHGIETPDERARTDKAKTGYLRLEARHQGGEVWLEITDDGRGLDPAKLIDKARQRGIISATQELTDEQAFQLIFEPGFSTAAAVTDISGRGVGMDVVRRNIEALRGRIEVKSQLGHGTTFTIRLPLTLAIIDAMLLRVGPAICALPLTSVQESFRPHTGQITHTSCTGAMVRIRDRMYSMLSLEGVYGPRWQARHDEGILVLVEDQGTSFCLVADEILGQRQLVIKPLDDYLAAIRGISGCSILGSGEICLILDVNNLARHCTASTTAEESSLAA